MKKNKGATLNLWLPAGYGGKVELLLGELEKRGIDLRDHRGYPSISALLRYLVDEKLHEIGAGNEKKS